MVRAYTPASLLYPIKVKKLLRKEGDQIAKNEPLFVYEFKTTVKEYSWEARDNVDVERAQYSNFESEFEGELVSLKVQEGQELTRRTVVAEVEEPCKHEVQFGGLCANCGQDMNEVQTYNQSSSMADRATINNVHGRTELLVSAEEATKADEEAKRRLLNTRRLSLVVDLDQTIIHASVEPTIGEWQNDPSNPNHEAVKDVCKFQLADDIPGRPGTWYYIKLRPGLLNFLETMSQYYEMHIYTMGTRAYAEEIAKIVDPNRKVFGDRILSRDESGSMQAKNLKRLFPVDTKMVVIIDDRADVWNWTPNLIKVNVYEFFVGIGDINSSFLPKRPELEAKKSVKMERSPSKKDSDPSSSETETADSVSTAPTTPPKTNGDSSPVAQMVSMAGKQDATSMKSKEEEREQQLTEQLEDRPLLQKQKILDKLEEEEANASPAVEAAKELLAENGDKSEEAPPDTTTKHKYRHNLLQDDDTELTHLEKSLRSIHEAYFDEYEKNTVGNKGSRVAELRPGHTKKLSVDEFQHIPDAAIIMSGLKQKVLAGCHIVFSGVIPQGIDISKHDTVIWAKSFGAKVTTDITKKTTHVIASPERRTQKIRKAVKKGGRIAIVSQSWLFACFSQWQKVDENPYRIHSDAPTNGAAGLPDSFEKQDYMLASSDEENADTEEPPTEDETDGEPTRNGLTLETDLDTDNEDLEKYQATTPEKEVSTEQQVDEIEAMLAELDEMSDDDSASNASDNESSQDDATPRKRKSSDMDSEDESRLQKRKKQAVSRTTSLTNMAAAQDVTEDAGGEGDDDLEALLAAEMSRDTDDEDLEAAAENGGGTGPLDS